MSGPVGLARRLTDWAWLMSKVEACGEWGGLVGVLRTQGELRF
jgi:hypothetical protein